MGFVKKLAQGGLFGIPAAIISNKKKSNKSSESKPQPTLMTMPSETRSLTTKYGG